MSVNRIILGVIVLGSLLFGYLIFVGDILRPRDWCSNEGFAIAGLKLLVSTEGTWKQADIDRNGIKDYWTLDVSCLHRMYRHNGTTKVIMIDIRMARSDANAFSRNNPAPFNIGNTNGLDVEDWGSTSSLSTAYTTTAISGYYFQAMILDENGVPYSQNTVGEKGIKACNTDKFAFVAFPQVYPTSGVNIFIVNEKGTIYQTDPNTDGDGKIILQWPGPDSAKVKGPGGKHWAVAE